MNNLIGLLFSATFIVVYGLASKKIERKILMGKHEDLKSKWGAILVTIGVAFVCLCIILLLFTLRKDFTLDSFFLWCGAYGIAILLCCRILLGVSKSIREMKSKVNDTDKI